MNEFDTMANQWDTIRRIERAKVIADEITDVLGEKYYEKALEFGCGTGLISLALSHKFKKIELMDSSRQMIDQLSHKINSSSLSHMKPLFFDMTKKDYDKSFDTIYSSMVLHHITNTKKLINKFYKMLNENGVLCIVDLDKNDGIFHSEEIDFQGHNGFFHKDIKSIMCSAGFKNVTIKTFYHGTKQIDGNEIPYSLFIISGVVNNAT